MIKSLIVSTPEIKITEGEYEEMSINDRNSVHPCKSGITILTEKQSRTVNAKSKDTDLKIKITRNRSKEINVLKVLKSANYEFCLDNFAYVNCTSIMYTSYICISLKRYQIKKSIGIKTKQPCRDEHNEPNGFLSKYFQNPF